jgi:hypothetical protein
MEPHGCELEIFAAKQEGGGEEEHHGADAREQQGWQRNEIDQDREQRGPDALKGRGEDRQGMAGRIAGVVLALHLFGHLVGKEACEQPGHRRHQEDRARDDAERGRDRENPGQDPKRCRGIGTERCLEPRLAAFAEPDQQAVQAERGDDDQEQGDTGRSQQDPAERRREHLIDGFDRGIEHESISSAI